jgi:hypothetical protein
MNCISGFQVINSDKALPMEMLHLHNGYGQNYGLILYRCQISGNVTRLEFENAPSDRAQVRQNHSNVNVSD